MIYDLTFLLSCLEIKVVCYGDKEQIYDYPPLALIGTLIVMTVLTVGMLWFGRREILDKRGFLVWFVLLYF